MKIQYVSDLHLEMQENAQWIKHNPLPVTGDVLVVAGDSGYVDSPDYRRLPFWQWASQHYREVIVAMGNHEFYQFSDIAQFPDGMCEPILPNVHLCYNAVCAVDDVDFIVSTLWAHIDPAEAYITERGVSDFYRILRSGNRLCAEGFNAEHDRCVAFLKQAVSQSKARRKVVVTHHVPSRLCMAEEFRGSSINGAFVCEMGEFIATSDIDLWIYGHSHRNIDAEIGPCRLVSNQLGYVRSAEHLLCGFNPAKFVEL